MSNIQRPFKIGAINTVKINPSILEGTKGYHSLLGPTLAVGINRIDPVLINLPFIIGPTLIPTELYCDPGSWDSSPTPKFSYQWLLDGGILVGETNQEITTTLAMDSLELVCRVTADNGEASAEATTLPIIPFIIQTADVTNFDHHIITGLVRENQSKLLYNNFYVSTGFIKEDQTILSESHAYIMERASQQDTQYDLRMGVYLVEFIDPDNKVTGYGHNYGNNYGL